MGRWGRGDVLRQPDVKACIVLKAVDKTSARGYVAVRCSFHVFDPFAVCFRCVERREYSRLVTRL